MRGAVSGGGERSQVEGAGEGELILVERSGLRWRGAVSDGRERSLVEGSGLRWMGAISDGGERSQVEGSDRW